jgi:hypothetical protein
MATATSIEAKIVLALETAVLPVAQGLGLPIAAPGVAYSPTGAPYLGVVIGKNTPINVSLSGGREPVRQGILLLQVYWPIGAGLLQATEAAAVLRDAFKFNHRIDFAGGFIKVTSEPTIQGDIIGDNGYLLIPVTVPWQAFT